MAVAESHEEAATVAYDGTRVGRWAEQDVIVADQ